MVSIHAPARGATCSPLFQGLNPAVFQSTRPHGARPAGTTPRVRRAGFNPRARTGRDPVSVDRSPAPFCFNPRARTGRDQLHRTRGHWSTRFNPRARTGRDQRVERVGHRVGVSIHAPARGATMPAITRVSTDMFQSTRPHGARLLCRAAPGRLYWFQSTRPHGARRVLHSANTPQPRVSIHAPARGATIPAAHSASGCAVSIHAPARGATQRVLERRVQRQVSIHAPARGATEVILKRMVEGGFQSTRPHGARHRNMISTHIRFWFQSTRPHGARRHAGRPAPRHRACFNPRARTGRDAMDEIAARRRMGFNPRARTGRDVGVSGPTVVVDGFNPRARTGRDRLHGVGCANQVVSIHAPARGATNLPDHGCHRQPCFNPRARTGRDGMLITQPHQCKKNFAIANPRALSRKNGKDHDRRSDASTKTTACRNANLRGGQRSLGVRGTRAGAANCSRGARCLGAHKKAAFQAALHQHAQPQANQLPATFMRLIRIEPTVLAP